MFNIVTVLYFTDTNKQPHTVFIYFINEFGLVFANICVIMYSSHFTALQHTDTHHTHNNIITYNIKIKVSLASKLVKRSSDR